MRIRRRLEPEFESWAMETVRYGKLLVSLIVAYIVFRILRVLNVAAWLVDILEPLDQGAAGIVFVAYLLTIVRSALAELFKGKN